MRALTPAFWLVGMIAATAIAQQPTINPRPRPPNPGLLELVPPSRPLQIPLTTAELAVIEGRLSDYRKLLLADTPRAEDLSRAGLAETVDAVEQARATPSDKIGPTHVGVLARLPVSPVVQVDPAVEAGARTTLHARLGREPSAVELQGEIAQFDARIARMNDGLAARRGEIARAMHSNGQFPQLLERQILGVVNVAQPSDPGEVEAGFQMLIRSLLLEDGATQPPSGVWVRPEPVSVPVLPAPGEPRDPR